MTRITVDEGRCKQCGMCAQICPVGIITTPGLGNVPSMPQSSELMCIYCGHCETVCPEGALRVMYLPTAQKARHAGEEDMLPQQLSLYMQSRRSVRHFKDQLVDPKIFEELLDIARFAPSASNGQPVQWIIVQDAQEVQRLTRSAIDWLRQLSADDPARALFPVKMAEGLIAAWEQGIDIVCRHAPHLVIAHARPGAPMALVDGTIALTYFELAAPTFGLGACWGGFFYRFLEASPQLREAVGIPAEHKPVGMLMVGYPKYTHHRIPQRNRVNVTWKSSHPPTP